MVSVADLKIYKTTNNLGGAITGTQLLNASPNNLFTNVPKNELVVGEDYYACVYLKNTHTIENMDNFVLWLSSKSFPHDTEIKWGLDTTTRSGYRWEPYGTFDGVNGNVGVLGIDDAPTLSLNNFTLSAWFRTNTGFPNSGVIAGKGKFSSEATGDNYNYVLYMDNANKIVGGYEEAAGTNHYATSTNSYNDNQWHFAIVSYDGANVKLDIDGSNVASPAATATPATNSLNFLIGKSSSETANLWNGNIDEVRLWNRALNSSEKTALYTNNTVPSGLVVERKFGTDENLTIAQTIADKYTAPTGITWKTIGTDITQNISKPTLGKQSYFPIWIWLHVNANAQARLDDNARWNFKFDIPSGGTSGGGTTGGVSGEGNPSVLSLDKFGINRLFPTKTGGLEWFNNWDNGHSRSISSDSFDSDDVKVANKNATAFSIDGNGTGSWNSLGTSHRLFVVGPWLNTEMTVLVKVDTQCDSVQLRGRSNHHGPQDLPYGGTDTESCGFGGYIVKWGEAGSNQVENEVEIIHDAYQRGLDVHNFTIPELGVWTGYKQIIRSVGTFAVKVEGWFNANIADQTDWVKQSEFEYDGTNVNPDSPSPNVTDCLTSGDSVSGDLIGNSKWLNASYWNWLRFNNADDVKLQKFSIREINPLPQPSSGGGGLPPPPTTDFKIAIVGDEGCGSTTNSVRDLIKNGGYDYAVSVGDHAYSSASCWTSTFSGLKPNFNSAYGNHEYSESGGISPYKTFFGHSKTYFTFQFRNVYFFVLDDNQFEDSSAPSMNVGSTQYNFIKSEMERVANDPSVTWRVLVAHHPWFGTSATHPANEGTQVEKYMQLAITNKVNFFLCGHNHHWERTHMVKYNSGDPRNPTVLDNLTPYDKTAAGLIGIVSGTGGHDSGSGLYPLSTDQPYWAYRNRTHNGIWEMVASNNGQTLTCSFVDTTGTKYDTFTIS
jgi:hypothetical protein